MPTAYGPPKLHNAVRPRRVSLRAGLAALDETIARLDQLADDQARTEYSKAKRFHFDWVDDPPREAAFRQRLERR